MHEQGHIDRQLSNTARPNAGTGRRLPADHPPRHGPLSRRPPGGPSANEGPASVFPLPLLPAEEQEVVPRGPTETTLALLLKDARREGQDLPD
ncbi:hypothetical protein GCM10009864_37940 [Streptomyces lunalinharesii]|uniref:Uncharacterized protein n=1 Tax=Streptomyces lunalinharesii TaxID=333384 RepID=A0ABP6EF11_9ACTN